MPDPFIIAELAQGYEGKPEQAHALLEAAGNAGADAAKFQLVYAEELATPDYQHFALFRRLEMPDGTWRDLAARARARHLEFHLDVFGPRSLALAEAVEAQALKVHSTDMGNPALLAAIAASRIEDVLLSTAGCTSAEIDRALEALKAKRLVLLHGFQGYPTPTEANRILRLREFGARYGGRAGLRLGFADHAEPGDALSVALAAAALGAGATVIEKHLTLDRRMKLEDYESALDPADFAAFVRNMRECSRALGPRTEAGSLHRSESEYRNKTRKHVVAARSLPAGTVLDAGHLALKRSASPVFIQEMSDVVGLRLARSVEADEAIRPDLLEKA